MKPTRTDLILRGLVYSIPVSVIAALLVITCFPVAEKLGPDFNDLTSIVVIEDRIRITNLRNPNGLFVHIELDDGQRIRILPACTQVGWAYINLKEAETRLNIDTD